MILSIQCPKCGRPLELPMTDITEAEARAIARRIVCEPCGQPAPWTPGSVCGHARTITDVRAGHRGTSMANRQTCEDHGKTF